MPQEQQLKPVGDSTELRGLNPEQGAARLAESLKLGDGFQFHMLVTDSLIHLNRTVEAVKERVASRVGRRLLVVMYDPYERPLESVGKLTTKALSVS
ncbi:hypothetical protein FJY70_05455, partial [candidate division WOR-3 bacterium]|nr:hypothetical protein [candidate division WOR-3 bacterium]